LITIVSSSLVTFEMLRDHSQHNGQRLADVAAAIVDSHLLLVPPTAVSE
jgi:hypothetical protein